jgi:hypothetical protein
MAVISDVWRIRIVPISVSSDFDVELMDRMGRTIWHGFVLKSIYVDFDVEADVKIEKTNVLIPGGVLKKMSIEIIAKSFGLTVELEGRGILPDSWEEMVVSSK